MKNVILWPRRARKKPSEAYMGIEIERKFKVNQKMLLGGGTRIHQGYLSVDPPVVRVRVVETGDTSAQWQAFMTTKGAGLLSRKEIEFPIPVPDAIELLCMTPHKIDKQRWEIRGPDKKIWTLDLFVDPHPGLMLAEIELQHEDEIFEKPDWVGEEVTDDKRYSNVNLARGPALHACGCGSTRHGPDHKSWDHAGWNPS
jgi:adenylate cyclase